MSRLQSLVKTNRRGTANLRTVLAEFVANDAENRNQATVRIPKAYHASLGLPAEHDGVVTAAFRDLDTNKKAPNFHDLAGRKGRRITDKDLKMASGGWVRLENVRKDGKDKVTASWVNVSGKVPRADTHVIDGLVRFSPILGRDDKIDPEDTRWRASVANIAAAEEVDMNADAIEAAVVAALEADSLGQSEAVLRIHDKETGGVAGIFVSRHWDKEDETVEPAAEAVKRAITASMDVDSIEAAVANLEESGLDVTLEVVPVSSFPASSYLREGASRAVQPGSQKERFGSPAGNIAKIKDSDFFGWSPGAVMVRHMEGDEERRAVTVALGVAMQNSRGYPLDAFDSPHTKGARKAYQQAQTSGDENADTQRSVESEADEAGASDNPDREAIENAVSDALDDEDYGQDMAPPV